MTLDSGTDFNISVTFRHTESTASLKSYATEKISHCLKKYISTNASIQIVLSVEKRDHSVEVKVLSKDYDLSGKAVTTDLYSAIDKVVDTLEAQVRKQKDRLRSHKHVSPREVELS